MQRKTHNSGNKVRVRSSFLAIAALACLAVSSQAGDLRLALPKRSKLTPVQKLNREGVKEVQKRHLEKAKKLFYEAYLLDPNDPFTLNNLGYISELDGDADRALRYYELSSKNASQATIEVSSRPELKGRPLQEAFAALRVPELQASKANVQAISLLGKGRVAEAEDVLRKVLAGDPHNPFTLNNMGFVMESEGDLESALKYYSSAASLHSGDVILVAPNVKWRGKPISEVAADNARQVSKTIAKGEDLQAQVARLNLRGVAALNHNDPQGAKEFFQQAYKLDPHNAFSLNNMGYVSELEGDRETAQTYYADARAAADRNLVVTFASRREAEGQPIRSVAQQNQDDTESAIAALQEARRREGEPVPRLKRRDNTLVPESSPELNRQAPPLNGVTPPALPSPQVPDRTQERPQGDNLLQPLPESQQPPAVQTPANQSPGATPPQGELLQPLPESQQPPAATGSGTTTAPQTGSAPPQ